MKLFLSRDTFTNSSTGGVLAINDEFFCYTLEDKDRQLETHPNAKVFGQTAIPRGVYTVTIDFSPKYQKNMPHVLGVPGFQGIRIHPGNTDADTEGCILLGQKRAYNTVLESKLAFDKFYPILLSAVNSNEHVELTIA